MKREYLRGVLILSLVIFLITIISAQGLIPAVLDENNNYPQGNIMNITNESFTEHNPNQPFETNEPKVMKSSFMALASQPNAIIIVWPEAGYYYVTDGMFLLINTTNPSTCTYSFNSGPEVSMIDNGTEHNEFIYNLVDNMASVDPYFVDFYCDDGSGVISDYTYFWINTTPLDSYFIRNDLGGWNYKLSTEIWSGEEEGLNDYYNSIYKKGDEPIYDMIRFWVFSNRSSLDAYVKKYFVDDTDPPFVSTQVIGGKNFYMWSGKDKSIAWTSGNYFIMDRVYAFENKTPVTLQIPNDVVNPYLTKYPNDLRIGTCGDGKVNVYNLNGQKEECDGNSQSITCGINVGECKPGLQVRKCNANCTWQSYGACNATTAKTEVCYDLKDNDCDGVVDENCERFTILSPNKSVYNTTGIFLTLNATIYKFSKIEYSDLPNLTKFTLLCTNCTNVSKKITFKEGNHSLIAKGTLANGTSIYNQTKFIIDTKLPTISGTKPMNLKYTNGTGFYIKYSEDNCKSLILNINGSNIKTSSCKSGKNINETFFQNISKYNNQTVNYKLIIVDSANHTKESTLTKIKVDTKSPEIKNFKVEKSLIGTYIIFNMTILNEDKYSFDEVDYIDNSALKPVWKPLCTSLAKGNVCYKKIYFKTGTHELIVKVKDNAGNSNSVSTNVKL